MSYLRVNNMLGVSRSFGDIMYKSTRPLQPLSEDDMLIVDVFDVWADDNQVISLPEVSEHWSCHDFFIC